MSAALGVAREPVHISVGEFASRLSLLVTQDAGVLDCAQVSLTTQRLIEHLADLPLRILPSSDGLVSEVHEDRIRNDFSRQSGNFDFHTDGLAYEAVPEFVLLYCDNPGSGAAATLIADTRRVCQRLSNVELALLAQCETGYLDRLGNTIRHPVVVDHPRSGEPVLNLGTHGLLQPWVTPEQPRDSPPLREVVRIMSKLYALIDDSIVRRHHWQRGDALLIDNYAYLHARSARDRDPHRKLLRMWLSATT